MEVTDNSPAGAHALFQSPPTGKLMSAMAESGSLGEP